MELSNKLLCLFSGEIEEEDERYIVEIPRREIDTGTIRIDETYRVALIAGEEETTEKSLDISPNDQPQPPVEEGEIRYVEIEDLGKQGDGIARVERGYVIIVPDTEVGDRVKIEISEVKSNFAVAEVLE